MESPASENSSLSMELESVSLVALDTGGLLMEAGASAVRVEEIVNKVARGLGAERVDLRIGYASMAVTIGAGPCTITRMRRVGHLGINRRLDQNLWRLASRVSAREISTNQTLRELAEIKAKTPVHNRWVTAFAIGLACAAFGRVLGVDWHATGPVFLAAAVGQYFRRILLTRGVNSYICTALVSFVASMICSLGLRWSGSKTVTVAVISSILFLIPGVPAVNAQSDILEGHPTLGSARVVTVVMTLIFVAVGIWMGPVLFNLWR